MNDQDNHNPATRKDLLDLLGAVNRFHEPRYVQLNEKINDLNAKVEHLEELVEWMARSMGRR